MFDDLVTEVRDAPRGAAALEGWARLENAACAHRLSAMLDMLDDAYTHAEATERDQWCIDNWAAVTAHIGAAQRITSHAASAMLLIAVSLRERFPTLHQSFLHGHLSYPMIRLIITRTALAITPEVWAALDTALAQQLTTGTPLSLGAAQRAIDALLWELDPHAVRRSQTRARDRRVEVHLDDETGMAQLFASLFAHDAHALTARLDAFAATVCPHDPRTHDQRRGDAVGALAHGLDRMACLCQRPDCPAAQTPPSTGVIIHIVAHHDTITPPPPQTPDTDADADGGDETSSTPTEPATEAETPLDVDGAAAAGTAAAPVGPTPQQECAALDGPPPPPFDKPLRELTLREALTDPDPGHRSTLPVAILLGGGVLPGAIAHRAALGATLSVITHPGQTPPEPRYRPSRKLAAFLRCRDQTCRFPGCKKPATHADLDHTTPYPHGPTAASNLACLCRFHHLLKTFWTGEHGWGQNHHRDGTIDWIAPDARTHPSIPASRDLFPHLCEPTAAVHTTAVPPTQHRGVTMPRRRNTRTHDRHRRIHEERQANRHAIDEHAARLLAETLREAERIMQQADKTAIQANADPPPF